MDKVKITFFGSSQFSVFCLEELKTLGLSPTLIVTTPDKPTGRGLKMSPTPVKTWAQVNKTECLTPEKLQTEFINNLKEKSGPNNIFLVASYGKIVPKLLLDLPTYGVLNIHPSLLPKYRGPSPLQAQILNDEKKIGVSLMLVDEKVDHGPIVAQESVVVENWPIKFGELEKITAQIGSKLFANHLKAWIKGEIKAVEQNHDEATFTKKIEKADGLINLENGNPYKNFLKIQAYSDWPQAYFFLEKNDKKIRVIVKDAEFKDDVLLIKKVLPEGKKEMTYEDFMRGIKN